MIRFAGLVSSQFERVLRALGLLLVLAGIAMAVQAQPKDARSAARFDHSKTGYTLTGQHIQTRCDSCHVQGLFKGTPKDCASCHTSGGRIQAPGKPLTHVQTSAACDSCHKTTAWAPARFDHVSVSGGTCKTCHATNAMGAPAKSAGHVETSASCDTCHTSMSSWVKISNFDHKGVVKGTCESCHNGSKARGKSPTHLPTNGAACDACHSTASFSAVTAFSHAGITGNCASCHDGKSRSKAAPTGGTLGAIHAGATVCESCHTSTTTFKQVTFKGQPAGHASFNGTTCTTCHFNGSTAINTNVPMPSLHPKVSSGTDCSSCHTKTAWKPATGNAMPADAVHTNSNTANCTTCHATGFDRVAALKAFPHSAIKGGVSCVACHDGKSAGVVSRPTGGSIGAVHAQTTADCASCHVNTSFRPARFAGTPSHAGFTGASCTTCHFNGSTAINTNAPMPSSHPKVSNSSDCSSCHSKTAWKPTTGNGMPADAVHNNSNTADCTVCHANGYDRTAALKAFQHSLIKPGASCVSCHGGSVSGVVSRPVGGASGAAHAQTTADCASCHVNTAFKPAKFSGTPAHTGFTGASCAFCHFDGTAAKNTNAPMPASHPKVSGSSDCSSCHTKTAWKPATAGAMPADVVHNNSTTTNCATCHSNGYDRSASLRTFQHSLVKAGVSCATCHSGSVTGVLGKPTSGILGGIHTAATGDCASCHVVGASFVPARFAAGSIPAGHAGFAAGSCATCHVNGTAAKNTNAPLSTGHPAVSASTDCSSCHTKTAWKPATAGAMPADVVHNNSTTTNCATCHSNGYDRSASLRTFQHSLVKAGVSCATCHSGSVTGVLGKPTSGILGGIHTAATGDCASCHVVGASFVPARFAAGSIPAGHAGFAAGSCATCHVNGTAAKNTNAPLSTGHPAVSASTDCSSCHTKTAWKPATAGAMPADVVHNNSTTTNCATCHSNGYDRSASLRTFQHSLVKAGVSCATCHSGSVTGVLGKPTSGILGGIHTAATGDCASCHVVGASFVPARFAAGSIPAGHAGFAAGSCATCHVNGTAAKNTNAPLSTGHPAVSASTDCSSCHTKTAWKPATAGAMPADVVHNNSTTTNCATCHSNGYDRSASLRTFQHSLVKAGVSCATCHSGSVTGVLGKPTSGILGGIHTAATGDCASCHVVGTTFVPARFAAGSIPAGHAGFAAGSCATCHVNGTAAKNTNAPLSTGHPAVSASTDCSSCHTKTAWKPATAGAMPADVVHNNSTTTNCATCHSNGYDRSASLRTFQHSLVKAGVSCATCHSGSVTGVLGKPTSGILGGIHTAATGDCASCHVVGTTFVPARFAAGSIPAGHAGFAAGSCATCHVNGTAAKNTNAPLSTGHPAVSASTDCSSCHTKTAWKPATAGAMPADVVHNNSTTTNCATCHSNGYDRSASLRTFQHSLVKAGVSCATCHSGSVTGVLGKPTSGILGGIHTAATGDCASCHVVGATFVPARFAAGSIPAGHAGFAAGSCATCHVNGTAAKNTNAPLSTGHPAVSASTDCSSCHTKTAWKPATAGAMPADVVHNNSTTTNCATCHSNGYDRSASLRTFQHSLVKAGVSCATCHSGSVTGVLGKPTSGILGGIHTAATGDCASCHVVGATFVPARFAAGSIPAGHAGFAAGSCATCHVNGTAAKNTNAPLSTGHPRSAPAPTAVAATPRRRGSRPPPGRCRPTWCITTAPPPTAPPATATATTAAPRCAPSSTAWSRPG